MPPPPRPPLWQERAANRLLRTFAPTLRPAPAADPPAALAPYEHVTFPRADGHVTAGTWYPANASPRGVVVMGPPWLEWGRAYFHRRERIEACREAGHAVLTFDLAGFGASTGRGRFRDFDAEAALQEAQRRASGAAVHAWGVSAGGVWLHVAQARTHIARSAFFEDVTPHLLEWRAHVTPASRPARAAFSLLLPKVDRFMDLRRHAPHMGLRASTYVVGDRDPGIPVEDARSLADAAGGTLHVVQGATHLAAIKRDGKRIVARAIDTFAQ